MYIIVLNYRSGVLEIEEVKDKGQDIGDYLTNKLDHTDYHYMTSVKLHLKINEE